ALDRRRAGASALRPAVRRQRGRDRRRLGARCPLRPVARGSRGRRRDGPHERRAPGGAGAGRVAAEVRGLRRGDGGNSRMRWALLSLAIAAALVGAGCSSSSSPGAKTAAPIPASRSPYDAPPAAAHSIQIQIDEKTAQEILGTLSRQKFEPADAKVLEEMPAVRLTIQDSTRPPEVFERDLAAAFDAT